MTAAQPAEATAECQPGDPGGRVDACWNGKAECLCREIDMAKRAARLDVRDATTRIDAHCAHERKVDHHAGIADSTSGNVVSAAAHCDREVMLPRKAESGADVGLPTALGNQCRPPVDHCVPDGARLVIRGIG